MAARLYQESIKDRLQAFRSAEGGNVMLTFALALVPIMGLVGSAIDYSRANAAKAAMQSAIDATALMLSKDAASLTTTDFNSKASGYFNALLTNKEVSGITLTPTYSTSGGSQVMIKATGNIPTTFMKVVGMASLDLDVSSTVKWGNTRLRVALVLDNTGSMSNAGKLTALKTATTGLLNQLQAAAAKDGDVYVSIIPFVKDVAVDPKINYSANWIDWTEWLAEPLVLDTTPAKGGSKPSSWYNTGPGSACPLSNSSQGFGCAQGATSTSNTNTIASSGNNRGLICPNTDNGQKKPAKNGVMYNGCYNSWTQCVGSACQCTEHRYQYMFLQKQRELEDLHNRLREIRTHLAPDQYQRDLHARARLEFGCPVRDARDQHLEWLHHRSRQVGRAEHGKLRHQYYDAVGRQPGNAVSGRAIQHLHQADDAAQLQLGGHEDTGQRHGGERQHQLGHRSGTRLAVPGRRGTVPDTARQGHEL